MIKYGDTIRLTKKEIETLTGLTGEVPNVRSKQALNGFIDLQLTKFGRSPEEKVIRHLLEAHKVA